MTHSIETKTEKNASDILLLGRDVAYIKVSVDKIQKTLDTQGASMNETFVRKSDFHHLYEKVEKINYIGDWIFRVIVGAVILSLLGLVLIK